MSTHFKVTLGILCGVVLALLAAGACIERRLAANGPVPKVTATVLGKNDKEIVSYNSDTHILTQVTDKGTSKIYTRNPEIIVGKNGSVTVKKNAYAFEVSPFIGVGYSRQFNTYVGVNLLNVWRVDGGLALAYSPAHTTGLVVVGVNVWRNTNISLGYDLQKNVHALVSVHF